MRQVYVARTLADVYLVKDYFESEGLHPEIRGEHLVGTQGGLPLTADTLPSIWVADDDAPRATQLLALRRQAPDEAGLPADDGFDDPDAHPSMAELFLAADRLRHTPDGELVDAVRRHGATVRATQAPYGIDARTWQRIGELAGDLDAAGADGDAEAITTAAAALRDYLRELV